MAALSIVKCQCQATDAPDDTFIGDYGTQSNLPRAASIWLVHSEPLLSTISLSVVSVTSGRRQLENIKWKILEVNNSCFKWCAILSSMMKSHAVPPCPKSFLCPASPCCTSYVNLPVGHFVTVPVTSSVIRRVHSRNWYYRILLYCSILLLLLSLLLYLIYKLNFVITVFVEKKT